jgi:hypothetical protein
LVTPRHARDCSQRERQRLAACAANQWCRCGTARKQDSEHGAVCWPSWLGAVGSTYTQKRLEERVPVRRKGIGEYWQGLSLDA